MNTLVSTVRRRRRAALAAALALAGLPLLVTSSADAAVCEPTNSCVTIEYVSTTKGVPTTVAGPFTYVINEQEELVTDPKKYTVRSKSGVAPKPVDDTQPKGIKNTLALRDLMKLADVEQGGKHDVTFSETPGVKKVPAVLAPERLDGSKTYSGGLVPAVYAVPGGGVGYVRPLDGKTTDVNASEVFTTPGTLTLTIHVTGDLLSVKVNPTPKKVTTSTPVSFSAEVSPNSDDLSYRWTLGTKVDKTASPSRTFPNKNTYAVNLTVRGDDGSYGRAATTTVKVGNPPKPPKTPGTGGSGGGDGIGGGGGGSGFIPPFVPNSPTIPSDGLPNDQPPIDDFPSAPVDDGLEQVEGFVLAGAGSEQGESIPGTEAAAQPTEANELSTTRKISGAAIGALAVLLLLGLGAEIETRWLSTRLGHLRRRA